MACEPRGNIDADLPWQTDGWRCLNCGEFRDGVIDQHRALTPRCAQSSRMRNATHEP